MSTFLALYRGDTVATARMVAVSADPQLVALVATRLLEAPPCPNENEDPVLECVESGRRSALHLIKHESSGEEGRDA